MGTAREKLTSELFHGVSVQQVSTIVKIEPKANTIFGDNIYDFFQ